MCYLPRVMICLISGTNRPQSQTLRVTRIFQKLFEAQGAQTQVLDLNELPPELFLPSAYAEKPAAFRRFSDTVLVADGLFIVSPEYNGGFPGVLKMFIDHLKFPESFEKRPVAFVGLAAGQWGAMRPIEQLQQIFGYRNAFIYPERIFLPRVESQILPDETFKDPLVRELSQNQVKGFLAFCAQLRRPHDRS
jgi:chromate reductase